MKKEYPSYKEEGIKPIEDRLKTKDRKVLEGFLTFCRATSGEYKVNERKSELLQAWDIIEKEFDKWTLEDIRGFCAVLNQSNRAVWTKKCIIVTLQMFLKYNWKDWSSRFNEFDDLKKIQRLLKPNNADKYNNATLPSAEEIDKMIRSADNYRDKLYITMLAESGIPAKVQLNLKWQDVKIDSPKAGYSTLEYFRNKNKESFIFPLKISTKYLKDWKQHFSYPNVRNDDYIFPSPEDRNKPLSDQTSWYMLKRLSKRAGLNKNVYQYLLRHKVLSEAYEKLPETIHRKCFGHVKNSKMTGFYSHSDKEKALMIALEKLHDVQELTPEENNELRALRKRVDEMEILLKEVAKHGKDLRQILQAKRS